jgi:DNA-binding Lrp family transcriptional regulator
MVVKVFLVVNVEPGRRDEIHKALHSFEEVSSVYDVESGPHDLVAMVQVENLDGYRDLIEKVAALPNTEDFASFITLDA